MYNKHLYLSAQPYLYLTYKMSNSQQLCEAWDCCIEISGEGNDSKSCLQVQHTDGMNKLLG